MNRIFITGGASGLGRAIAERYAKEKWAVCIGDLNDERGHETVKALEGMGVKAHYLHCDVRKEADFETALAWLEKEWMGVDIVVNNAGVATAGRIDEQTLEDWNWIIDINLMGVVRGSKIFTPLFRKQGKGAFINIASIAGFVSMPGGSAYCATKSAVVALSEVMHLELTRHGLGVSVVCPYFFKTNLTESLRTASAKSVAAMEKNVAQSKVSASTIADRIYRGASRGDFFIFPDRPSKFLYRLKRTLPHSLFERLLRKFA